MSNPVLERATPDDDAAVRALLRRTPMAGDIRVAFEREPALAHSAAVEGDRHHMFVVREGGRVTGVCSRVVRPVFFRGAPARIGYLGLLRTERPAAAVRHLLAEGFDACRATREPDELPFDFTSIMSDNLPARRLLERGLPGLPRYVAMAEFRTLVFAARGAPGGRTFRCAADEGVDRSGEVRGSKEIRIVRGSEVGAGTIAAYLQEQYARHPLAPVWTEADLRSDEVTRGLGIDDFVVAMRGDSIAGCAALWDQSAFRQNVVRGYVPWLAAARPVVNAWNRLTGEPRLPAVGERLRIATISHVAVSDDEPAIAIALVERIGQIAAARDLELLVLGLAAQRELFPRLREVLRARVLESILYTVHDGGQDPDGLDARVPHVEVATL